MSKELLEQLLVSVHVYVWFVQSSLFVNVPSLQNPLLVHELFAVHTQLDLLTAAPQIFTPLHPVALFSYFHPLPTPLSAAQVPKYSHLI